MQYQQNQFQYEPTLPTTNQFQFQIQSPQPPRKQSSQEFIQVTLQEEPTIENTNIPWNPEKENLDRQQNYSFQWSNNAFQTMLLQPLHQAIIQPDVSDPLLPIHQNTQTQEKNRPKQKELKKPRTAFLELEDGEEEETQQLQQQNQQQQQSQQQKRTPHCRARLFKFSAVNTTIAFIFILPLMTCSFADWCSSEEPIAFYICLFQFLFQSIGNMAICTLVSSDKLTAKGYRRWLILAFYEALAANVLTFFFFCTSPSIQAEEIENQESFWVAILNQVWLSNLVLWLMASNLLVATTSQLIDIGLSLDTELEEEERQAQKSCCM